MALAAFQRALATLYVDAGARASFARDPVGFGRAHGLDATERERLRLLGAAHATAYAETLARKRRNELARLAPRTAAALGPRWDATVRTYLATSGPREARAVSDARRFARFVADRPEFAAARRAALEDLGALR